MGEVPRLKRRAFPKPRPPYGAHPGADYTAEELEVLRAVDRYCRRWGRRFPEVTEVLAVLKSLGYRRQRRR
jgi:hypothetical protein